VKQLLVLARPIYEDDEKREKYGFGMDCLFCYLLGSISFSSTSSIYLILVGRIWCGFVHARSWDWCVFARERDNTMKG
jgi:hypothetical protein